MYPFKIGIITDSFQTDFFTALEKAHKLGASGIQTRATGGDFSPESLTSAKRKEILSLVKDKNMVFSALCGDLGKGFGDAELNPSLIEKSKRILDLAKDLETDVVTTHIGVVPTDKKHPRYQIMLEACSELAEYADSISAHFAIETGPETADVLKEFLDQLNSKGVSVNLDPANFVMVTGDDPVKAVYTLKDYIVHTHAKDGRKLKDVSPEIIYHLEENDMLSSNAFIELPLGQGDVDFPNYLKALHEIGYQGYLTIEREVGDNPEKDIGTAVSFLQNLI